MSNEDNLENENEAVLMRHRARLITIKLHNNKNSTLRRQASASNSPEFLEHKSAPPVFESGDEVSGTAHLEVNGGHPVAKIRLAIVCLSQVRWQTHTAKQRRSVISLITGDESGNNNKNHQIYFDRKIIREVDLGKSSGKNSILFSS